MKQLIKIENLAVGYKKEVLFDLNLNVNENEIIVIIGENGAGKSTLIQTLAGLLKPKSGNLSLNGILIQDWKTQELAKFQSYVSSAVLPDLMMTVQEFVSFGRYPYMNWLAKPNSEDIELITKSIADCDLEYLSEKNIGQLSDGEKQKVLLARAFAQETKVMILDEPTTHLDIKNSNAMFKLIQKSKEELGKSVLFSSHQVEKALKIADKVWLVHQGEVKECTVSEFSNNALFQEIIFG